MQQGVYRFKNIFFLIIYQLLIDYLLIDYLPIIYRFLPDLFHDLIHYLVCPQKGLRPFYATIYSRGQVN